MSSLCPRQKNKWLGVELASSCHVWLQEHETIFPRNRRPERWAKLVAGEGDGGEMEFLPQCLGKKRGKEEVREALASKVSRLPLEHCQGTVDSLARLTGEQNCSHLALFSPQAKALEGD